MYFLIYFVILFCPGIYQQFNISLINKIHQTDIDSSSKGINSSITPAKTQIEDGSCMVNIANLEQCPLCQAEIIFWSNSSSNAVNKWKAVFEESYIVDCKTIIENRKCKGIIVKIVSWGDKTQSYADSDESIGVRKTARSVKLNHHQRDDDNDERPEESSADGDVDDLILPTKFDLPVDHSHDAFAKTYTVPEKSLEHAKIFYPSVKSAR